MKSRGGAIIRTTALLAAVSASAVPVCAAGKTGVELNSCLESALRRAYGQRQGAAAVVSVGTGRLIASWRLDDAATRLLLPGSALKPFSLLAMLERGVVQPGAGRYCSRRVRIEGRNLDCSHAPLSSPIDASMALALSCNQYFAEHSLHLRPEDLGNTVRRFGITSLTGFTLREAAGRVSIPRGAPALQLQALGADRIRVTHLGLLRGYLNLARRILSPLGASPAVRLVQQGLILSVREGTGQAASVPGLDVAGKTGTARLPGQAWPQAWFAGFLPSSKPALVFVFMTETGSGASDAAPLAGAVLSACREPIRKLSAPHSPPQ